MASKRISAATLTALREALVVIYWYKGDLRNFLNASVSNRELVNRLNWDDVKRNIVSSLIDYLTRHQDQHQEDLLRLMHEVTLMLDFRHLEQLEDGPKKAADAKEAVAALKALYVTHQDIVDENARVEENRRIANERQLQNKGVRDKLLILRETFTELFTSTNPQARGYSLEKIIRELFSLFDLDPKASFRVEGEQIDGAFTFDSTDYLLEAKWQKALVDIADLDAFAGKISRKLENTLGLFLSLNGFSQDAIKAHSTGRKQVILMDGRDLMAVLEERINLQQLLLRKRRHAAQTGDVYLTIDQILYN